MTIPYRVMRLALYHVTCNCRGGQKQPYNRWPWFCFWLCSFTEFR